MSARMARRNTAGFITQSFRFGSDTARRRPFFPHTTPRGRFCCMMTRAIGSPVRVTDDGMTAVDGSCRPIHCAMSWKDLAAFEDLLVERLVSE